MDILNGLFSIAAAYVVVASGLVWGITETIKRTMVSEDKKHRYAPYIAFCASVVVSVLAWLYMEDLTIKSLIPFILGSLLIFAGSDTVHDVKKAVFKEGDSTE